MDVRKISVLLQYENKKRAAITAVNCLPTTAEWPEYYDRFIEIAAASATKSIAIAESIA